jgi:predicted dehydrogenase
MKPLRTGIIGCGRIAQKHAAVLANLADVNLAAFCDENTASAQAFKQQYGRGEVYGDAQTMFTQAGLDLVYICLPPFAHGDEVDLACQHKVHFLIEKPIALSMELAEHMAAQVQAAGVKSQVGFMYRHGEAALWLKRYMTEKRSTGQGFMMGRYACNALHRAWWRDRARSGGQLVEQVIHIVDLARFYLGEAAEVYSVQDNLFHRNLPDYTIEDVSVTIIKFQSGGIATISATNGAIPGRWDCDWRLVLPELTADFQDANHAVFHQTSQPWTATTTVAAEKDMFLAQALDLLSAIRDDRPTSVPIEEGVRSLGLALAATQSAQSHTPVTMAPAALPTRGSRR